MWQTAAVLLIVAGAAVYLVVRFGRRLVGRASRGCGFCPCENEGKPGGEPPCKSLEGRLHRYGQRQPAETPPCYKACLRDNDQEHPKEKHS
jgi:hypothetical protein